MSDGEIINLIGRIFVVFYYVWAAWFNAQNRGFHLAEFGRIGMPAGGALLAAGILIQIVGSILFLVPGAIVCGAAILIVFTVVADGFFHRYWTYSNPQEATIHKFFLFEHVALIGGILGLASSHL